MKWTAQYFHGWGCQGSCKFETKEQAIRWANEWIAKLGRGTQAVVSKKGKSKPIFLGSE